MTSITTRSLTFDEFLKVVSQDGFYELIDGKIVELEPIRAHQKVADFLLDSLKAEARRFNLDYYITDKVVVRTLTKGGTERGRRPDVSVVEESVWDSALMSYAALREPLQLAVEVVSTNWRDDYIEKLDEYRRLGIIEYWIVDYLALASEEYLGQPKVPTISIYFLDDGQYQMSQFRGSDHLISSTFPKLDLTVEQVVAASLPRRQT